MRVVGESLKPHKLQSALFPPLTWVVVVSINYGLRVIANIYIKVNTHKSVDVGRNYNTGSKRGGGKILGKRKTVFFFHSVCAGKNEYSSACVHSSEQ